MSDFLDSLSGLSEQPGERRVGRIGGGALSTRLQALASEGRAAFEEQGLPGRRSERWKGSSLAPLERLALARIGPAQGSTPSGDAQLERAGAAGADFSADLLFVDGRIAQTGTQRTTLGGGVRILSLEEAAAEVPDLVTSHLGQLADAKQDPFTALHDACFEDAAVIVLEPGARAERALRILCVATADAPDRPTAQFPRVLIAAGEGSDADLMIENVALGDAPGFSSLLTEIRVEAGARFGLVSLQNETADRVHLSQTHARLDRDARLETHVLSTSAGFVRSELTVGLEAPGATTQMQGLFIGRDEAHHDHFTTVDHAAPHCESDEEYRGVLAGRSRGVFRGRVIVRPGAQKTNARQSNPNLLLSGDAAIDTKPQLEIYADDVKASHGSTIGQLDADALFFLRARGIDEPDARLLLTRGFARSITDGIHDPDLRALVGQRIDDVLEALVAGPVREGSA